MYITVLRVGLPLFEVVATIYVVLIDQTTVQVQDLRSCGPHLATGCIRLIF